MPDVKVTVGFGWKTGVNATAETTGAVVVIDDIADKVGFGWALFCHVFAPVLGR